MNKLADNNRKDHIEYLALEAMKSYNKICDLADQYPAPKPIPERDYELMSVLISNTIRQVELLYLIATPYSAKKHLEKIINLQEQKVSFKEITKTLHDQLNLFRQDFINETELN